MQKIRFMTQTAVIAALYAALTLLFMPVSFGVIQFRISEVLTVLPMFTPAAVPGLALGCLLANCIGGAGLSDIILGSFATLLAAVLSYLLRAHKWLVPLPPVICNGVLVGAYLYLLAPLESTLWFAIGSVGFSELVIAYGFGVPFIHFLQKRRTHFFLKK